jgi:hypothetical protein
MWVVCSLQQIGISGRNFVGVGRCLVCTHLKVGPEASLLPLVSFHCSVFLLDLLCLGLALLYVVLLGHCPILRVWG